MSALNRGLSSSAIREAQRQRDLVMSIVTLPGGRRLRRQVPASSVRGDELSQNLGRSSSSSSSSRSGSNNSRTSSAAGTTPGAARRADGASSSSPRSPGSTSTGGRRSSSRHSDAGEAQGEGRTGAHDRTRAGGGRGEARLVAASSRGSLTHLDANAEGGGAFAAGQRSTPASPTWVSSVPQEDRRLSRNLSLDRRARGERRNTTPSTQGRRGDQHAQQSTLILSISPTPSSGGISALPFASASAASRTAAAAALASRRYLQVRVHAYVHPMCVACMLSTEEARSVNRRFLSVPVATCVWTSFLSW